VRSSRNWRRLAGFTFGLKEIIAYFGTQTVGSRWSRGKLGDDVRPGTYKAILKQTKIKEEPE
jgi:hypothetical protein